MHRIRFLFVWLVMGMIILVSCGKPSLEATQTNEQIIIEDTLAITSTAIVVESQNETLWIKIDVPEDGAVVTTPELEIRGSASNGSVITINDDILYVEIGEEFSDKITLESGANLLEIVASDADGNEVQLFLTVYYETQE